jgi:hypothetical protein
METTDKCQALGLYDEQKTEKQAAENASYEQKEKT